MAWESQEVVGSVELWQSAMALLGGHRSRTRPPALKKGSASHYYVTMPLHNFMCTAESTESVVA